ncbi:DUF6152 family protein [Sphingobium lignivorans]|uniref:D-arabinose 1-dehydrogenase-like Zn-dependent alcohol dehydrogenase n=1 Tax=Sphingobium lignivorans TaxID=2735886 RepID=A0ABR6NA50_9SPHN|nr:DUF6152 family protein [Sphingobium lignivorans]MBB5984155.1 D-arabinose 1-dehydrogenase-like Zn-dependent alcohol dehydrogenase [Sphingobium lignivorans]
MRLCHIAHAGLLTLMLPLSSLAAAHHGWSSYDARKTIEIEGSLKTLRWANPHGAATVHHDGRDWDVVLAPVARMEARGLTEAMMKPGGTVTLIGYPRTDGTAEMRIERVIVKGKAYELR